MSKKKFLIILFLIDLLFSLGIFFVNSLYNNKKSLINYTKIELNDNNNPNYKDNWLNKR